MKETQRLIKGLVACGVAIAMVSTLAAQSSDLTAKVVRIKGSARYSTTGTSEWKPLKVGAELAPGTLIQTDTDSASYVDLILGQVSNENEVMPVSYNPTTSTTSASSANYTGHESKATQNIVRLASNTLLSVDKLTQVQTGADPASETELDLRTGSIVGRAKKISAGSRFEIKVPNGVAAIRGTDFRISTIDQHHTAGTAAAVLGVEVWVSSGSVVLSWTPANGQPVTEVIRPNQIVNTINGTVQPMTPDQHILLNTQLGSLPVFGAPTAPPVINVPTPTPPQHPIPNPVSGF